jgi:hypothetical protein
MLVQVEPLGLPAIRLILVDWSEIGFLSMMLLGLGIALSLGNSWRIRWAQMLGGFRRLCKERNKRQSPINRASNALPESPVSLALGDVVPHIMTQMVSAERAAALRNKCLSWRRPVDRVQVRRVNGRRSRDS